MVVVVVVVVVCCCVLLCVVVCCCVLLCVVVCCCVLLCVVVCCCVLLCVVVAGVSHDNPRTPNVHILGHRPFKKHHQNSTRRPPREGRMNEHGGVEREKKNAKFWASHPSGPHPWGPHFSRIGATQFGAHPSGPPTQILAKVGQLRLAKLGQIFLARVGLAKVGSNKDGQSRSQPKIGGLSSAQAKCNLDQFWLAPLTIKNVKR